MGPVNWLAVVLAANMAVAVGIVWYGPLFRSGRPLLEGQGKAVRSYGWVVAAMLLAATMMGHNFARLGAETLAGKPWLYWMMSGGFALWFVVPALFIGLARHGVATRDRLIDCGFWTAAFLTMGTTFWALG